MFIFALMRYFAVILLLLLVFACNSYDNYAKKAQKTFISLLDAIEKQDIQRIKEVCDKNGLRTSEESIPLDSILYFAEHQTTLKEWLAMHKEHIINQADKNYQWSGDTVDFNYGHDFSHHYYSRFILSKSGEYKLLKISTTDLK
jgi:hypothetical protein